MHSKFALYGFDGAPKDWYFVDEVEVPKPVLEPTVSHHIVVVDRSGSMWGVMDDTKTMVEKVMTVEEFTSSGLLLTLISYSSKGDYTVHFSRTAVGDVLDPKQGHIQKIRDIRATCLTSISGALDEALKHIQGKETTAISIHTDGYFNDSSPGAEAKAVDKWIKGVVKMPNVFVNTISYGNWTDFKILDKIASSLSGKCVIAKNVKQVYEALHDTSSLLAGRVLPAIHIAKEDADFLACLNLSQKKVNASTTDFQVKGVGPDDRTKLFRYRRVTQERWDKDSRSEADGDALVPVFAFARAKLAEGKINDAKYALCGTRDGELLKMHYKALTPVALSALAADLDTRVAGDLASYVRSDKPGLATEKMSVLALCQTLEKYRKDFTVDMEKFLNGYSRRGVKRLNGEWVDGKFVASRTKLKPADDFTNVSIEGFELNNTSATINMNVNRPAELYKDGEKVTVVAGKKLDMRNIQSYTLVGDGEINADVLPLNISNRKLFAELAKGNIVSGEYDYRNTYEIPLKDLPACDFGTSFDLPTKEQFNELIRLVTKRNILKACLGGAATVDEWTAEQITELKSYDLSPSLNYNPSTTNPYTDLNTAISAGEVDSRTSYKVTIGDNRMVSTAALYSANEYLARRFSVKPAQGSEAEVDKDGFLKKPKLSELAGATVDLKTLSARTKLNAIDDLMFPLFEEFPLKGGFDGVGVTSNQEAIADALQQCEDELEAAWAAIRPLAFYIGATGLVPDSWDVEIIDAEALKARFEGIDVEKKQMDGSFFVKGDVVIGAFPEVAYFSTEKGEQVARSLME
jgi:hypothetical protein